MRLHVSAKVRAVGERPAADLALERLLARVRAHVTLQQPRPRECLAANVTLARQRVRADVHFERAERIVGFLAEFTLKLFLHLSDAVKLLVLGKTAVGRVGLGTAVALVARIEVGGRRGRRRASVWGRGDG